MFLLQILNHILSIQMETSCKHSHVRQTQGRLFHSEDKRTDTLVCKLRRGEAEDIACGLWSPATWTRCSGSRNLLFPTSLRNSVAYPS